MEPHGPGRVLDIRDVALALRCSETTVKQLVARGNLRKPRHILTKSVWFQADLDEYLRRLDRGDFEEDVEEEELPEGPQPRKKQ